jgi:hypothetical protein
MKTLEYYESMLEERNEQILLTSSISLPSDGDGPERQMTYPPQWTGEEDSTRVGSNINK